MYKLALTWLLGMLGFLVLSGCAMAAGLWVRERLARGSGEAGIGDGELPR